MSSHNKSAIKRLFTVCRMWQFIGCLTVCVCAVGCSSKAYVPSGEEAEHLRKLAVNYMRYVTKSKGKSPPSEKHFKDFIASMGRDRKEVEELFISPRDGKPYVVLYNVRITGNSAVVVAYEQDGIDGTRYVAFDFGGVEMADEERFKLMVQHGVETNIKQ